MSKWDLSYDCKMYFNSRHALWFHCWHVWPWNFGSVTQTSTAYLGLSNSANSSSADTGLSTPTCNRTPGETTAFSVPPRTPWPHKSWLPDMESPTHTCYKHYPRAFCCQSVWLSQSKEMKKKRVNTYFSTSGKTCNNWLGLRIQGGHECKCSAVNWDR